MFENLKEKLDKGIEYAFMTSEKITKAAKELAKENNLTKEEAKNYWIICRKNQKRPGIIWKKPCRISSKQA